MSSVNNELGQPAAVSFSFGRNWKSYSRLVSEATIQKAQGDIVDWLGGDSVNGKSVVDIGCGSGIHSLGFFRLGAKSLLSMDVDPHSVTCTQRFWRRAGKPTSWRVTSGSILDTTAMEALGQFDIVYSWGVLHHTGQLWTAMDNASRLGNRENSRLWISIYAKGPDYAEQLKLKQRFNGWSWFYKQAYVLRTLLRSWRNERRAGQKFGEWFWRGRGMNIYHDTVDWLGGLPYEVASVEEVKTFLEERGWTLHRVKEGEACTVYLFQR
jgi:2-polyprenyl-6-hydroxyphenyl methylase/3-demethylubiquinone-9 3-methyltransferase